MRNVTLLNQKNHLSLGCFPPENNTTTIHWRNKIHVYMFNTTFSGTFIWVDYLPHPNHIVCILLWELSVLYLMQQCTCSFAPTIHPLVWTDSALLYAFLTFSFFIVVLLYSHLPCSMYSLLTENNENYLKGLFKYSSKDCVICINK